MWFESGEYITQSPVGPCGEFDMPISNAGLMRSSCNARSRDLDIFPLNRLSPCF